MFTAVHDLGWCIRLYENGLSEDLCRGIWRGFHDDPRPPGRMYGGPGDEKLSLDWEMDGDIYKALNEEVLASLRPIFAEYCQTYPIIGEFPYMADTGYLVQKYEEGVGRYDWHIDASPCPPDDGWEAVGAPTHERWLAALCYINTVPLGGHTEFRFPGVRIPPVQGNVLLVPPFWTHEHRGTIPFGSDKMMLTTFFVQAAPPAPPDAGDGLVPNGAVRRLSDLPPPDEAKT